MPPLPTVDFQEPPIVWEVPVLLLTPLLISRPVDRAQA